jgi:hypothetical protein
MTQDELQGIIQVVLHAADHRDNLGAKMLLLKGKNEAAHNAGAMYSPASKALSGMVAPLQALDTAIICERESRPKSECIPFRD